MRPGHPLSSAVGVPDSGDSIHGGTGVSLRTGSLRNKIHGTGEKRKGKLIVSTDESNWNLETFNLGLNLDLHFSTSISDST
jgi:hypothetical protein